MNSVSSHDGSENDLRQRTNDGLMPSQTYLRKFDFMESNDSLRSSRDTDTWSLAATAGDQESVISTNTQKSRPIPDVDDDSIQSTTNPSNSNEVLDQTETFLDIESVYVETCVSQFDENVTRATRFLFPECDDEALDDFNSVVDSATGDGDNGDNDDEVGKDTQTDHDQHLSDNDEEQHYQHRTSYSPIVMDDSIRAPTEPQPSIANMDKQHIHLMEENELLHSQLRDLEITTKRQQNIINSLQSHHHPNNDSLRSELNSNILSEQLTTWAKKITHFSTHWTTTSTQQRQVEQDLFYHVMEYYLNALPFGTENQILLNTAYQDHLTRFHNTLGPLFAKWYRRKTVQSLKRNPATHDYLQNAHILMTQDIALALDMDSALLTDLGDWQLLLDACAKLSLELHSSEQDVLIRPLAPGSIYDANIMTDIHDDMSDTMPLDAISTTTTDDLVKDHQVERRIKSIICPLFIDEQDTVLLPARVILEYC